MPGTPPRHGSPERAPAPFRRRGFTLLELLAGLAIVAILLAVAVPAVTSLGNASRLDATARTVADELNLGRQLALARNRAVEVRLYQLPGENAPAGSPPGPYRGLQLFLVAEDAATPAMPLDRPFFFPATLAITPDARFSSLLSAAAPGEAPSDKLPGYGLNYAYRSFRFRPDGRTDLPGGDALGLTLLNERDAARGDTGLPANYATLQVDPVTGRVFIFRP